MKKATATIKSARERYDRDNLQAALIIIADPAQFPEGSGAEQWARLFMRRLQRDQQRAAGRLFEAAQQSDATV